MDAERRLLEVLARVTDRDRLVCRVLQEHRVLTTVQVADVGFDGIRRARQRLTDLAVLELVDRFRPRTKQAAAPWHWVLGPLGAALVAAERGVEVSDLRWRRGLVHDLACNQRLGHLVGTNGFFSALVRTSRHRPGCELAAWWSERRCAQEWGELVRPDGYGIWIESGARCPFLLEYDTGSERLARLSAKLAGYGQLAAAAGHPNWVLFCFLTPRREVEARRVLGHPVVPVATAVVGNGQAPDAAIWLPVGSTGSRLPLIAFGAVDAARPK